jgi:hypothetical protein
MNKSGMNEPGISLKAELETVDSPMNHALIGQQRKSSELMMMRLLSFSFQLLVV